MSDTTVGVVGAGPAGLAAAFRLAEAGCRVRVFESSDYVGGRMKTVHRDGFLIEEGAIWMPDSYSSLLGLVKDAGLGAEIVRSRAMFGFRRDGTTHVLDCDHLARSAPGFNLVSSKSKAQLARIMLDAARHRKSVRAGDLSALAALDDESAHDYTMRLSNQEVLDHIVNPMLRGIAGDSPDALSKLDLLYTLATFTGRVRGMAFRNGMSSVISALASRFEVRLGASVLDVRDAGDEVELTWIDRHGDQHGERMAGVVLAVPPKNAVGMHRDLDEARRTFLGSIGCTPVVNITVCTTRAPDFPFTYVPVSEVTNPDLLLVGLLHNLCAGRTPPGKGMITAYPAPELSRQLYDASDDVAAKRLIDAIEDVLPGAIGDIEFIHLNRWDPLVTVSRPGYYRDLAEFNRLSSADRRIHLAGDYYSVSSMNSASSSGERAGRALLARLA